MGVLGVSLAIVVYGNLCIAAPQILFPINSQVPPVARASIPFTFVFAPSTFSTDLPNTYTLSNAPSWLSLDSETRTLSGTPTAEDADLKISITASDGTGSVTMNSELVVRKEPAPTVQIPLESQLASFSAFSAPSTVFYYPSSHFNIEFPPQTFLENGGNSTLNYYAVSQNNTPLPAWVSFDSDSLTFSGETPDSKSLIQPPETFGIKLIASDVEGFAGPSITFNIAVGFHKLTFTNATIEVKGKGGQAFQYEGLAGNLKLDDQIISSANLTSINAQTPNWLNFDNSTFVLSGNPPANAPSSNVTVTAIDLYGDIASTLITIDLSTSLFVQNISQLTATIGEFFSYDLTSSLVDASQVVTTARFEPNTPWLSFDTGTITLSGDVPAGRSPSTVHITLRASSRTSSDTQSISVVLNVVSQIMPPSSSTTSLQTSVLASATTSTTRHHSATKSASHAASVDNNGYRRKLSKGEIAAIVAPLVLLILAVSSYFVWLGCRRQDKRRNGARSPAKSDISGPVPAISPSLVPEIGTFNQALPSKQKPRKNQEGLPTSAPFYQGAHRPRGSKNTIRKVQTMSDLSGFRQSHLAESRSSGTQGRSFSENALTSRSSDWDMSSRRRTQESTYPDFSSRPNSQPPPRNFSRKRGGSHQSLKRDDNSTNTNMAYFSGVPSSSMNSSIQHTPEKNYNSNVYSHHPRTLVPTDEDQDDFESEPLVIPRGLPRPPSSWLTERYYNRESARESAFSAGTQDAGLLFDHSYTSKSENSKSIRMVPSSPQPPAKAHLSTIEASPMTVFLPSRSGGSCFFGGSRSSSRTHESPSLRGAYSTSPRAYANTGSPALPAPIPTKTKQSTFANFLTTPETHHRLSPNPPPMMQPSIEKMVSAAGLCSDNDTPHLRIGLGIGHGRIIGNSSSSHNNAQRHSFLGMISDRLSRTFQIRRSSKHGPSDGGHETDTESQFHEADSVHRQTPPQTSPPQHQGLARQRASHQLRPTMIFHRSNSETGEDSEEDDDYDVGSSEASIVAQYRRSLTQTNNNHRHSSFRRDSNGVPFEYALDEESPTLGLGTIGEVQRVVVRGQHSREFLSASVQEMGGSRSPVVREKVGAEMGDDHDRLGLGIGLGLGLGLRQMDDDDEAGRIIGNRGRRPGSILDAGYGPVEKREAADETRSFAAARKHKRYEYEEEEDEENAFESGRSAFL